MERTRSRPFLVSSRAEYRYVNAVAQIRKIFDENGMKHIELWQGEGGYPSWAYEGHGLVRDGKTSERSQAVYQLRRYFIDVFRGIKRSSFFQIADVWEKPYAKVFEVTDFVTERIKTTTYQKLPIYNYPLILTERSAFVIEEE